MTTVHPFWARLCAIAILLCTGLCAGLTATQAVQLETRHTPTSDISVAYQDWDKILKSVVWDIGPSDRRAVGAYNTGLTKIRRGNPNPTRGESNRVFYHLFKDSHINTLRMLRDTLAATPNEVPLAEWSKTEQLVYFLNLHNIAVMAEIAERYPRRTLKSLMKDKDGIWHQPIMTIEGQAVSIRDLERHIVTNWDDPRVLYGLYLGAVGGPNIIRAAYTRDTVWDLLDTNAKEFVNSLRGIRFFRNTARVSLLYDIGRPLFDDFDADLRAHLERFTNPYVTGKLHQTNRITADNYDWHIADLMEGSTAVGVTPSGDRAGSLSLFIQNETGTRQFNNVLSLAGFTNSTKLPPHAVDLVEKIYAKHERRNYEAVVGIEEVKRGETPKAPDDGDDPENPEDDGGEGEEGGNDEDDGGNDGGGR